MSKLTKFDLNLERLKVRELQIEDFEAIHEYAKQPEVSEFQQWGPNDEAATQEFILRALTTAAATPRSNYELGITEISSGQLVGVRLIHALPGSSRNWDYS